MTGIQINYVPDGYTPTTEEVRNGYVGAESEPNPYVSEDERAEFDRWLAGVKAQEAKVERERAMSIIMTNIGQIVWQARNNPEGQAIDMSKICKAIMGEEQNV